MIELVENFIDWVAKDPLKSSAAIVIVYIGLVIFTFPIMYLTVALGYAYTKAWARKKSDFNLFLDEHSLSSSLVGFLGAFCLITLAVLLGA
jgi:hypothetical protein